MRFSKISVTKKAVELTRTSRDKNGAVEDITLNSPERPLSTFSDALQSFVPYVVGLLDLPDSWHEETNGEVTKELLTVTTLNLSEDKNGNRGLIVTAIKPVAKAYGKPLVLNTPLVREGAEDASDDAFVLTDAVLELIGIVEEEATRYTEGERVQGELFAKKAATAQPTSENAKNFDQRAAAAEVASTRRPKSRKGAKNATPGEPVHVKGVGMLMNPDATEVLSDAGMQQLLRTVDREVPIDAIARWVSTDWSLAEKWARSRQRELVNSLHKDEIVPAEPECITQFATQQLPADEWQGTAPPRAADVTPVRM